MLDHTLEFRIKAFRVLRLGVDDLLVNIHGIIVDKRSVSSVHFVHQDSEGPPIHRLAVTSVQKDLRGDVFGSTTDSVSSLLDDLSKAIIDKLEVTICADHDVFGLEISVDDVLGMQVLEYRSDLSTVESRESHNDFKQVRIKRYLLSLFSVEVAYSSVVCEQITTWEKFSGEVDVAVVLEVTIVA
jgi:hypothetical protein